MIFVLKQNFCILDMKNLTPCSYRTSVKLPIQDVIQYKTNKEKAFGSKQVIQNYTLYIQFVLL